MGDGMNEQVLPPQVLAIEPFEGNAGADLFP